MKLYRLPNGLFRIGDAILPTGTCILELKDNDSFLVWRDIATGSIVAQSYIGRIEKQNGTNYTDLDELLDAIKDYFIPEVSAGGTPVPPVPNPTPEFITDMVTDFSLLPDADSEDGNFFVVLYDAMVGGNRKHAGIYLSRGDVWKRVVKFVGV